jgi:hypothetical protein
MHAQTTTCMLLSCHLNICNGCYIFPSYDHLQVEMYTVDINSTDNGSVFLRIFVILVDYGDRFLVTVKVVNCWS